MTAPKIGSTQIDVSVDTTARVHSLRNLYIDPAKQSPVRYVNGMRAQSRYESRAVQRVMLISPPATLYKGDLPRCTYPLGLGYLAAVLLASNYEVTILDCLVEGYYQMSPVPGDENFVTYGLTADQITRRIKEFGPDVVGVSSIFSNQSDSVAEVFRAIDAAAPNAYVVTGGAHARYFPQNYVEDFKVDAVFLSEAEGTFLQYLEALNGFGEIEEIMSLFAQKNGRLVTNDVMPLIRRKQRDENGFLAEIDHIPFPAWHLYNMERYFEIGAYQSPYTVGNRVGQIYTSRGCTAKCTFCTTTNFWGGKLRRRSPENVIREIETLRDEYGINEFHIQDDNITNDKAHAKHLFRYLSDLKMPWCTPQGTALWRMDEELLDLMAQSGCYQITFAIESGVQRVLDDLIRKPLDLERTRHLIAYASNLGMSVHGFFIIGMPPMFGNPGETLEEMQMTYNFAEEAGFDSASFFAATPIVGSVLLSEAMRQNFIASDTPLYRMSYKQGLLNVPGLWHGQQIADLAARYNKLFNTGKVRNGRRVWKEEQY